MTFKRIVLVLALVGTIGAVTAQEPPDQERAPRPGDVGQTKEGIEFRLPQVKPLQRVEQEPLGVEVVDVHELAIGTHVGNPGDLLVTFTGSGFMATSKNPVVHLAGGEVILDDTLTDLAGTRLFVLISRETASKVERLRFSDLLIVNPGGHEDSEFGQIKVEASPELLLRPEEGAAKAQLIYRKGEFVRELVEG